VYEINYSNITYLFYALTIKTTPFRFLNSKNYRTGRTIRDKIQLRIKKMLIKAKPADNTYLIPMFLNNYCWSWMCYVIWHTIFPVDWYYFISRIVHATCTDCRSTENGGEGNIISTGPYHDPMAVCYPDIAFHISDYCVYCIEDQNLTQTI